MMLHAFVGIANPEGAEIPPGAYLMSYDPEAFDGLGDVRWTTDYRKAMRFGSAADAMRLYRTQSSTRPFRDDGRPNRPLTAATVEVMTWEDVEPQTRTKRDTV